MIKSKTIILATVAIITTLLLGVVGVNASSQIDETPKTINRTPIIKHNKETKLVKSGKFGAVYFKTYRMGTSKPIIYKTSWNQTMSKYKYKLVLIKRNAYVNKKVKVYETTDFMSHFSTTINKNKRKKVITFYEDSCVVRKIMASKYLKINPQKSYWKEINGKKNIVPYESINKNRIITR